MPRAAAAVRSRLRRRPNASLFEDEGSALRWTKAAVIAGQVVTLTEGTELAEAQWRPLLGARPWSGS